VKKIKLMGTNIVGMLGLLLMLIHPLFEKKKTKRGNQVQELRKEQRI